MAFTHKENSGSLFKNNRKEQDTHADYSGSLNVEGKMFWLNAWLNKAENGAPYLSIRVKLKQQQQEKPALKVVGNNDPNDEIPF